MFKQNLKIAWRSIIRDRQFTILNLLGLSTGLASVILIYLWVTDEMNMDKFHQKDSHLYRVMHNLRLPEGVQTLDITPSPLADALKKDMPEVEYAAAVNIFRDWYKGPGVISYSNNNIRAQGIFATKDYFDVFSYKIVKGDKNQLLTNKNGVVISTELARKLFKSDENFLGKSLEWSHVMQLRGPFYVSGVFESPPANSTNQFDVIFNYENLLDGDIYAKEWNATYAETYVVLKKGTDIAAFNNKIADVLKSRHSNNDKSSLFVQQFSRKYLHGRFENGVEAGGSIVYVNLFVLIGIFILLIACINFMNLSTAQASRRMKEIGVKKTIGANQRSLIFQLLGESLLMACLALGISIGLIMLLLPEFNHITGKQLTLDLTSSMILQMLIITIATGLLSGCYPAFYLSSFDPIVILKGKLRTSVGEVWVRKGLVVTQFAISVIFIVAFIVVNKQIEYTQKQNLGYSKDNIVTFKSEGAMDSAKFETFVSVIKTTPGVVNVSSMFGSILRDVSTHTGFAWSTDASAQKDMLITSPLVSYDFIETMGIAVKEGQSFSRAHGDERNKIVLNEAAVELMGLDNPVGKSIKWGTNQMQIVGVVKNFHYGSLHHKLDPVILLFSPYTRDVLVKVKAGSERSTVDKLEGVFKQFHPKYPFQFTFLDEDYQDLYASEERVGILSKYFAGLSIIISCLGLFGLAAFTAQRRKKEIGIRKIVGAGVSDIVSMLAKDFLRLVCLAIIIALPVAWIAMNAWLNDFAYKTTISWWVLAAAAAVTLLVSMITVIFQSVKAALTTPVKTVRAE